MTSTRSSQRLPPPTADQLVGPPPQGLDEQWALQNFLGKTQAEARAMSRNSAITEDFTYLAAEGLCYYLPAALGYLESEESAGCWDFAHGLMCALATQAGIFGMRGEPLVFIRRIADYCDTHREKFALGSEDLLDEYLQTIRQA